MTCSIALRICSLNTGCPWADRHGRIDPDRGAARQERPAPGRDAVSPIRVWSAGRVRGRERRRAAFARLSLDPAMRTIVDRRGLDRNAASTSKMGRFETEWLASEGNFAYSYPWRCPLGTIAMDLKVIWEMSVQTFLESQSEGASGMPFPFPRPCTSRNPAHRAHQGRLNQFRDSECAAPRNV